MDNKEITSLDLDILGEIGNIGAGNAATALSQMTNKPVYLEIPLVKLCLLTDVPEVLGGAEVLRTGVFFEITKALKGFMSFILKDEDVYKISKIVAGDYDIDPRSVLSEVSNIISGAYIAAIASMINDEIDLSPPEVGHDMLGAMIDSLISSLCRVGDKTVIIGTELIINDETISGFYVLMLEQTSLNKLLDYFNSRLSSI